MKNVTAVLLFLIGTLLPAMSQTPVIFDANTDVTLGAKKIATTWVYAVGKWSNTDKQTGGSSTQIECYKRLGYCVVASAFTVFGTAELDMNDYDVLRWDTKEMIAVDSSPICVVITLRMDFANKKVSISRTSKGETKDKTCVEMESTLASTAFLIGGNAGTPEKHK